MKRGLFIFLVCMLLTGCARGVHNTNHEPDDVISTAIQEVNDTGDIYYQGKHSYDNNNAIYYEYLIIYEKEGQLDRMVSAVNDILEKEQIDDKICIDCWIELPGGAGRVAQIANYSDETLSIPDYDKMQGLSIGTTHHDSIYANPNTYINLPDMKRLSILDTIQKKAETEGIDWYEYWPNLEEIEVFSYE